MEELHEHKHKWYTFGCKDATFLMSKSEFAPLSVSEKFLLGFHKATCKYCRRFAEQAKKIDQYIRSSAASNLLKLTPERKQALNQLITKNSGN
jgi:hypothetical protein